MESKTLTLGDAAHMLSKLSFGTMVKPGGSACNLGCTYCYYLDKARLYGGKEPVMSPELLETYIKQYIEAVDGDEVSFCWHGGEPLLLGVDFFKRAVDLQRKWAGGKKVNNSLQTNGLKVDDEWCRFFHKNNFLIGLSLDGPRDIHDGYRKTKSGKPTFDSVLAAAKVFHRHEVEFNTLSVVNHFSEGRGVEIYRFLRDEVGSRYMQFLPAADKDMPWEVSGLGYGRFLVDIFDEWVRKDVGETFVQIFDATLALWCGVNPGLCSLSETCCDSLTVEHNGDVYPCDHFVGPQYLIGNITQTPLRALYETPQRFDFALSKRDSLPKECLRCEFYNVCHGECPEHRRDGHNVLCEGLKLYFAHVTPAMNKMREFLSEGRAPADIMNSNIR